MTEDTWDDGIGDLVRESVQPLPLLGYEDADAEWAKSTVSPKDTFVHTESYEAFKQDSYLFLFGRRGTGKTAAVRMLESQIRSGSVRGYSCACRIDQDEAYIELATQARLGHLGELPLPELRHLTKKMWLWISHLAAMLEVFRSAEGTDSEAQDLLTIRDFLFAQGLLNIGQPHPDPTSGPVRALLNLVSRELNSIGYDLQFLGAAHAAITKALDAPEYQRAKQALARTLRSRGGLCVVFVDSIDVYNIQDTLSDGILGGLVEAALTLFNACPTVGVIMKAVLPSELYTHLRVSNREKVDGRNLFVQWRFKDLVSLVAKRYLKLLTPNCEKGALKSLDDYENAKTFLALRIPETIVTRAGVTFDTLAYVISHTQRKPRQVILLFNTILTLARNKGITDDDCIPEAMVISGVHARLDMLVNGALDIYDSIYASGSDLVRGVLTDGPREFSYQEIDKRLQDIHGIRTQAQLTREQVKQLLFECGAVGLVPRNAGVVDGGRVKMALFEYQVKGTLLFRQESTCVVHPMFLQQMRCQGNRAVLVYPYAAEDEERTALRRQGIQVGGAD